MNKKLVSIITPCFNEEGNVQTLVKLVIEQFEKLPQYEYEHIFIDNDSSDDTLKQLRELASNDKRVKIIVNSRNFGHIRSPFYALLQSTGDCTISLVADLQDPPDLIPQFLKKWEEGYKVVAGIKKESAESAAMFFIRSFYYNLINRLSEIPLKKNFTGFGLYDREVINQFKEMKDPYPYFRGMISEVGFKNTEILYSQPVRKRGITSNNFLTLYDIAMLGIVTHSKIPLRIATISGFLLSILALVTAIIYFIAKLLFWENFSMGIAPVVFGLFFFASVQLFFLGIIGEYIGFIFTKVSNRPLVHEQERINFN